MMGPRQSRESKLFYAGVNIEERVDPAHRLRKIAAAVDFASIRPQVAELYGVRGQPSLDPTLVLKLLFLLFYENVVSERELLRQLPCRLDWLWFLDLDLDSPIPDHSVLSKARRRWGQKVFAGFFQQILTQCVRAGLVDGSKVHVDGSLIAANADAGKLTLALQLAGESLYGQLEAAAAASDQPAGPPPVAAAGIPAPAVTVSAPAGIPAPAATVPAPAPAPVSDPVPPPAAAVPPGTLYCPSDPEARLTHKYGRSVLGYKDHRVVDDRYGIITATLTTAAAVDEGAMLPAVLEAHQRNTGLIPTEPTADKAYGTVANYCLLQQCGCTPCIPHKQVREDPDKFPRARFVYDSQADVYHCPAGQTLHRRGVPSEDRYRYQTARGVCESCPLRAQCTASAGGRVLSRQVRQDAIDWADHCLSPAQRRARMRRRKIRAEGSFADAANRHGYKRARWRGQARVTIQNLLIATTQNLRKLVRYGHTPPRRLGERLTQAALRLPPHSSATARRMARFRPILRQNSANIYPCARTQRRRHRSRFGRSRPVEK